MTDDLAWLDATAQADLVRRGEVSSQELVDAAIGRIDKVDSELNSVIHRRFDRATREAGGELPDGPFRGVPFLVKDLYQASAGDPMHNGTRVLRDAGYVPAADSWLVGRYRTAGFVIVGRTNTPEFGLVPTTEPEAHGATRNRDGNIGVGTTDGDSCRKAWANKIVRLPATLAAVKRLSVLSSNRL